MGDPPKPSIDDILKLRAEDEFRHYVLPDIIGIALVAAGVRTACAFESSFHIGDAATELLKSYVATYYPNVIVSAAKFLGKNKIFIASKKRYAHIRSQYELGKILGFSCANQWKSIGGEEDPPVKYSYALEAEFANNTRLTIFTMMCLDTGRIHELKAMRCAAENALRIDPVFAGKIRKVHFKMETHHSTAELAALLVKGGPLDSETQEELHNRVRFSRLHMKDYDLNNSVHRGILATILIGTPLFFGDLTEMEKERDRFVVGLHESLRDSRKTRRRRRHLSVTRRQRRER